MSKTLNQLSSNTKVSRSRSYSVFMRTLFPHFLHLRLEPVTEISLKGTRRPQFWHLAKRSFLRSFFWMLSINAVKML